MSRGWLVWAPFGLFVGVWAVLGLRYGYIAATVDESDVIASIAARYLQERQQAGDDTAKLTDCVAYPGKDKGIWLVVTCAGAGAGTGYAYHVNRIGQFVHGGDTLRSEPQT